jgi:hypothetical protein
MAEGQFIHEASIASTVSLFIEHWRLDLQLVLTWL